MEEKSVKTTNLDAEREALNKLKAMGYGCGDVFDMILINDPVIGPRIRHLQIERQISYMLHPENQ